MINDNRIWSPRYDFRNFFGSNDPSRRNFGNFSDSFSYYFRNLICFLFTSTSSHKMTFFFSFKDFYVTRLSQLHNL